MISGYIPAIAILVSISAMDTLKVQGNGILRTHTLAGNVVVV
jgi:hypothetical protein